MKSQTVKPTNKVIDVITSARLISRLATALRNANKDSITPDELDQMARMLATKAQSL